MFLIAGLVWAMTLASRPQAAATSEASAQAGAQEQGGGVRWEKFSPAALDAALATDKPVFLAFSAAWCLSSCFRRGASDSGKATLTA